MEKFEKASLLSGKDASSQVKSLPLVLPNNVKYDPATATVTHLQSVARTHLEIVPSTVEVLSQIRECVAVLSIAGMARSGKSYLLSRILGSSDAFSLGHSMDPETFGIWIGTQVLKNKDFTIVLVDTEGIDAASAEKKNDISLLVLTILLSSYFVFNTISVPKQAQLEDLECFVQLVKGLRVNQEGKEDYNNFPAIFPDFLWLLRDVNLIPTDERGNEIDAKTFLMERVLKSSSGGFEEKTSDKVARAIKMFFPSIDCVTLPVPSDDPAIMRHVESSEKKLSPKFNEGVKAVVAHILERVRPKAGYKTDTHVTGSQLACMLGTYVEAVNTPGAIPVVETSWESSLRILAERFHQEAVEIYRRGMTAGLDARGEEPMEADGDNGDTLLDLHRKCYGVAKENVRKGLGPLCNEVQQAEFVSRLQEAVFGSKGRRPNTEQVSGLYHDYWRANYEKSLAYCQRLREALYEPIAKNVSGKDKGYTFKKLTEDLEEFEVNYRAKSKGPAKEKVYEDFTEFMKSEEKTFAKLEEFKKEEFAEQQRAAEMSTKLKNMFEEQRQLEAMMVEEMEENKKQAEALNEEYNEKIDKMKEEEREVYVQRMNEQTEKMQENMRENMKMLTDVADKNQQFMEKTLKMAQEQRNEEQKQMVEMVKAVQERNARLAKEMAEQAAKKDTNPLAQIGDFITKVSSLVSVFGGLQGKLPKFGSKAAAKK